MEILEVQLSFWAFSFQCVKLNGDISSRVKDSETAKCLEMWRHYYRHYSEKPEHISLLSNRMATVLQLCSLVWGAARGATQRGLFGAGLRVFLL